MGVRVMVEDESGNFYVSINLNNKIYAEIFPCGIQEPVNKRQKTPNLPNISL